MHEEAWQTQREGGSNMKSNDSDKLARLATAANPAEAHVMEQALRAEGISCRVVGDFLDAGIGDIPGVQAEIWVHQDDLARAQKVLQEARAEREPTEADEPEA
jgi:hypothetical protein